MRVTKDDVDKFFDYGISLPTRTIYMGSIINDVEGEESGVDASMAEYIIKALHILDIKSNSPITIIMNNPGGDYYHGMAIYDAIKACRSEVTIQAYGHAMSMGSIILQAADKRILSPNCRFMIHYGYMSMGFNHTKIYQKWSEECKKMDKFMEQLYLGIIRKVQPNFKLEKLKKMLDFDTILSAEETIKLGLADEISEHKSF